MIRPALFAALALAVLLPARATAQPSVPGTFLVVDAKVQDGKFTWTEMKPVPVTKWSVSQITSELIWTFGCARRHDRTPDFHGRESCPDRDPKSLPSRTTFCNRLALPCDDERYSFKRLNAFDSCC